MKTIFKKIFCCENYLQAEKQSYEEILFNYNIEKIEELYQDLRLLNVRLEGLLCPNFKSLYKDENHFLFYEDIFIGVLYIKISCSENKIKFAFQNVSHELNYCKIPNHICTDIFEEVSQCIESAKQQLKKQNNRKMMYLMLSKNNAKNNNN